MPAPGVRTVVHTAFKDTFIGGVGRCDKRALLCALDDLP